MGGLRVPWLKSQGPPKPPWVAWNNA
jgi:hypothetical protein